MATFIPHLPRGVCRALLVLMLLFGLGACARQQEGPSGPVDITRDPVSMGDYEIEGVEVRGNHLEYRAVSGERIRVFLRGPGVLSADNGSFRFDLDFVTGDVRETVLDDGRVESSLHISRHRGANGRIHESYRFHDGSKLDLRRGPGRDRSELQARFLEWYRPRAQRARLLDNAQGRRLMGFLNAPQFHRSLLTGLGSQLSAQPPIMDPELLDEISRYMRRGKEDDDVTESICDLLSICAAVKCTLGGGPANPGCDACIGGAIGCRLGRLLNRVFDAIFGDGRGRRPIGWTWSPEAVRSGGGEWSGGYWPW